MKARIKVTRGRRSWLWRADCSDPRCGRIGVWVLWDRAMFYAQAHLRTEHG